MAPNSKIGVMKANQSFCCGFCFEGRSRDELSTISDFLSGFRRKFIRHVTLVYGTDNQNEGGNKNRQIGQNCAMNCKISGNDSNKNLIK